MQEVYQSKAESSEPTDSRMQKIFLGGLAWDTNEAKLKQHFSQYGEIEEVMVMRHRVSGKPRGFGFITFKNYDNAQQALSEEHVLDGRQIEAKPSVPHIPKTIKKIFVGGLAKETTQDEFQSYFEQFGAVTEALIMQDPISGRSRGFGFVTFAGEESVKNVFQSGSHHEIAGQRVEVKPATPKGSGPIGRGILFPPTPGPPTMFHPRGMPMIPPAYPYHPHPYHPQFGIMVGPPPSWPGYTYPGMTYDYSSRQYQAQGSSTQAVPDSSQPTTSGSMASARQQIPQLGMQGWAAYEQQTSVRGGPMSGRGGGSGSAKRQ